MSEPAVRALSEADFEAEAEPLFRRVFVGSNPFDTPFAVGVAARAILFPVRYRLPSAFLKAILDAASRQGETAFYLSVLERPSAAEQDRPYHWRVPFAHVAAYESLGYPFVLENAIYSCDGSWGVMFSHESHAVMGGTVDFAEAVRPSIPNANKQAADFIAAWRSNERRLGANVAWLSGLLSHIYGESSAARLLSEA